MKREGRQTETEYREKGDGERDVSKKKCSQIRMQTDKAYRQQHDRNCVCTTAEDADSPPRTDEPLPGQPSLGGYVCLSGTTTEPHCV